MRIVWEYILSRAREGSTWRGLILLVLGGTGWSMSDTQVNQLVTLALSIVGAMGAFFPDKLGPKD